MQMSKKSRTFAEKFKIRMEKITFDKRNYRRHDEKNKRVIRKSLEELGAGRSVVIDKDGALIAGNGVYEQAQKLKMPVRVVETDGSELVVVKRTDLATGDEKRKRLALADNVASDLSDFDDDLLHEDFSMEELSDWGLEFEQEQRGDMADGGDLPPNSGNGFKYESKYGVIVMCGSEEEQEQVYNKLTSEGYSCKVVSV